MESLKLSFNAIFPIFILMLLGYFLKKIKITDKKGVDTVNNLVIMSSPFCLITLFGWIFTLSYINLL